ncbi:hypothetical protein ACIO3O_22195 [Streptomyces sp. NPDC087440]|uniref:hypothetical protein n=1 Tax=Streptomyces sp. NPDC087440 TaxID=3365790 RepID=UPI003811A15A
MAKVLGTCMAAAALTLTVAGPAFAARGFLYIDGQAIREPSGCYQLGDFVPSTVGNQTDQVVVVWTGSGCTGNVEYVINPGGSYTGGRSVFV